MATEEEYDEIIAPMLAKVAERCKELGMSITARVEWEPGEAGITSIGVGPDSGIAQRLAWYAAMSCGNLDSMIIRMKKDGIDMSQTIVGSMFERRSVDDEREASGE